MLAQHLTKETPCFFNMGRVPYLGVVDREVCDQAAGKGVWIQLSQLLIPQQSQLVKLFFLLVGMGMSAAGTLV